MAEGKDEADQDEKESTKNTRSHDDQSGSLASQTSRPGPVRDSAGGEDTTLSDDNGEDEDEDEDEGEEDRPHLKYLRMTARLNAVYRNADVTSTVTISGDKMVRLKTRL